MQGCGFHAHTFYEETIYPFKWSVKTILKNCKKELKMDYKEFSDEITKMIRPQSYPLGMKLLKDEDALPEKAARPAKYGIKISLCQWTTMARRWDESWAQLRTILIVRHVLRVWG